MTRSQATAAQAASSKPLLAALSGRTQLRPPVWLMRQAGRYLPEYRDVRAKAGGFLGLVYNPEMAAEVTVQPVRRFGMDAAILFSDILVIPQALGRAPAFTAGEGPRLEPVRGPSDIPAFSPTHFENTLAPVYETVSRTRAQLAAEGFADTALIGFAGAPWTIACYMVQGEGDNEFLAARRWAYADPESFGKLIDIITDATIKYLSRQIEAGAETVKIFDSWAGLAGETLFRQWVVPPTRRIVQALRAAHPSVPIIGFPRGAGYLYQSYARDTGVTAVALDQNVPVTWAAAALQPQLPVQGNLDPACLLAGGDAMALAVEQIVGTLGLKPFVFNLGHGINKDTPPEHVAALVKQIRALDGQGGA